MCRLLFYPLIWAWVPILRLCHHFQRIVVATCPILPIVIENYFLAVRTGNKAFPLGVLEPSHLPLPFPKGPDTLPVRLPEDFLRCLSFHFCVLSRVLFRPHVSRFRLIFLLPLLAWPYYMACQYYRWSNRDLRRLMSSSRAPLLTQFGETLHGLEVIRAYRAEEETASVSLTFLGATPRPASSAVFPSHRFEGAPGVVGGDSAGW